MYKSATRKFGAYTLTELYKDLRKTFPASSYPNNKPGRYQAMCDSIQSSYALGLINNKQRDRAIGWANTYIG